MLPLKWNVEVRSFVQRKEKRIENFPLLDISSSFLSFFLYSCFYFYGLDIFIYHVKADMLNFFLSTIYSLHNTQTQTQLLCRCAHLVLFISFSYFFLISIFCCCCSFCIAYAYFSLNLICSFNVDLSGSLFIRIFFSYLFPFSFLPLHSLFKKQQKNTFFIQV